MWLHIFSTIFHRILFYLVFSFWSCYLLCMLLSVNAFNVMRDDPWIYPSYTILKDIVSVSHNQVWFEMELQTME